MIVNSQAVLVENTLYVSGQIGMNPQTGDLVPGGVVHETEQVSINRVYHCHTHWSYFQTKVLTKVLIQHFACLCTLRNDLLCSCFSFQVTANLQMLSL